MKFQAVKGTRDFYPDAMRLRNWIVETWRRVSLRNGFEEYDSPIFEYLDLFTIKSGDEIAGQLFSFTDRGGRKLAIRPEITPSLARMVNAKINSLPRPIKWFSVPRLCRAENPQRGRLREFLQWNVDVIGSEDVLADAECAFAAIDALRELGLTKSDVVLRYSSRELLATVLTNWGVKDEEQSRKVMAVLDKRGKIPEDDFDKLLTSEIPDDDARMGVLRFLNMSEIDAGSAESIARNVGMESTQAVVEAVGKLKRFREYLTSFGVEGWCEYDTRIVRGLAYYTGIVYEILDAGGSPRALAGGGRYDNLLGVLGGPEVAATGFGMGDVVLGLLLEEKGKVPPEARQRRGDFFVIDGEEGQIADVLKVVWALRTMVLVAEMSYKRQSLGKQLKTADRQGAAQAVIVRGGGVVVRDMTDGEQREMSVEAFLAEARPR